MPKIDPVTGVPVATLGEMIARFAAEDGITPEEEWNKMMADDAQMREDDAASLREHALEILQSAVREYNGYGEDTIPEPVALVKVLSAEVDASAFSRCAHERISALARQADGTVDMIVYVHTSWSGTRLDPPEDEVEVYWEGLRDAG